MTWREYLHENHISNFSNFLEQTWVHKTRIQTKNDGSWNEVVPVFNET